MKSKPPYKVLFEAPSVSDDEVKQAQNFDEILKKSKLATGNTAPPDSRFRIGRVSLLVLAILLLLTTVGWLGFDQDTPAANRTNLEPKVETLSNTIEKEDVRLTQQNIKEEKPLKEENKERLESTRKIKKRVKPLLSTKPQKEVEVKKDEADLSKVKSLTKTNTEARIDKEKSKGLDPDFVPSYERAQPINGFPQLYQYFADSLRYPESLKDSKISGTVKVRFIINEVGKPENISLVNSLNEAMDLEAIRVVGQMPLWKPAKRNGKVIKSSLTIPLTFQIKDTEE